MDYSKLIEDYVASLGNSYSISVGKSGDDYVATVYYGDEEIENYLGTGSCFTITFSFIDVDTHENAVGFEVDIAACEVPGISEDVSNLSMALALLEEVVRYTQLFFRKIDMDREIWLSLD